MTRILVVFCFLSCGGAWAAGGSIAFRVVNESELVLRKIHVTPSTDGRWGEDLLQGVALEPGQQRSLAATGDCGLYDILMVAPGGTDLIAEEVEFCEGGDVIAVKPGGKIEKDPAGDR